VNAAAPWQRVLLRYAPDALSEFLERSRTRDQFVANYNRAYADLTAGRQAFVALIEGLAHCSNELTTPLRDVAYEQAALKAQGNRVRGTGKYSRAADIHVRRKKSYAVPGIKKARSVLLWGYALTTGNTPRSINTWRPLRRLLVPLLGLADDPLRNEQQKDEVCYAAIRSLLRTLEQNNSVSANEAKKTFRQMIAQQPITWLLLAIHNGGPRFAPTTFFTLLFWKEEKTRVGNRPRSSVFPFIDTRDN
jgi:hypothetical protein